jgi:mono/diheme cytochrome c family protein
VRSCARSSACLFVALSLLIVGCDFPGRPNRADRPVRADQVVEFGVLYRQNCAGCHGAEGKLCPAPPLNDPLFRAIVPEDELKNILTNGRSQTLMPAFAKENGGTLTAAQIEVLVHEIKGIPYTAIKNEEDAKASVKVVADPGGRAPKWGAPGKPPANVPSYSESSAHSKSSSSGGDTTKGAAVFVRACADCHGDRGQGTADGGTTTNKINDPEFLALNSDQVLRRYVITGRPDFGMPSFSEARPGDALFQPMSEQEVTDLVSLLASWRQTTVKGE